MQIYPMQIETAKNCLLRISLDRYIIELESKSAVQTCLFVLVEKRRKKKLKQVGGKRKGEMRKDMKDENSYFIFYLYKIYKLRI